MLLLERLWLCECGMCTCMKLHVSVWLLVYPGWGYEHVNVYVEWYTGVCCVVCLNGSSVLLFRCSDASV